MAAPLGRTYFARIMARAMSTPRINLLSQTEGAKDASRAIMAGGNRARARDLQDHDEAREELSQWRLSTGGTAGLFRRSKPSEARRGSSFCPKRCRDQALLARRDWSDAQGSHGTLGDSRCDCCFHGAPLGRTEGTKVGILRARSGRGITRLAERHTICVAEHSR